MEPRHDVVKTPRPQGEVTERFQLTVSTEVPASTARAVSDRAFRGSQVTQLMPSGAERAGPAEPCPNCTSVNKTNVAIWGWYVLQQ